MKETRHKIIDAVWFFFFFFREAQEKLKLILGDRNQKCWFWGEELTGKEHQETCQGEWLSYIFVLGDGYTDIYFILSKPNKLNT